MIGKIKMIGDASAFSGISKKIKKLSTIVWILAANIWNDAGVWDDAETWND